MIELEKLVTKTDRITARARRKNALRLHLGEPDFPVPSYVKEEIIGFFKESIEKGYTRYTDPRGIRELREVLSEKLHRKNKIDAEPSQIVVTAGGTAALSLIFRLIAANDYVAIPDPAWFAYPSIIRVAEAKIVRIPENSYNYETLSKITEELRKKEGELKAIVVNSPSNPTGYVYSREELREIIDFAEDYSVFVISDEVYEDYPLTREPISVASINSEKVFSVYSMSKTYGLTGLRIGYLVAPNKELARKITIMQLHTYVCPTSMAQYIALRCIEEKIEEKLLPIWLKEIKTNISLTRKRLSEENIEWKEPMGGIYAWIGLPSIDSWIFARELLEKKLVSVAVGEDFGPRWKSYIRILLAVSNEKYSEGFSRILEFYKEIKEEH